MDGALENPMLAAALQYAGWGWHVLPCYPGSKKPMAARGSQDASNDPEQVRSWWAGCPAANIGVALKPSGLMAIDADTYKPDCGWAAFAKGRELPSTLVQRSANGGTHYIFKAPPGSSFPGKLCESVDIKHNGHIVLAPSIVNGGQYRFENDLEPAPVPDWVSRRKERATQEAAPAGQERDIRELARLLGERQNTIRNRDDWVRLIHALRHTGGDELKAAFLEWSYRWDRETRQGDPERVWDSCRPAGDVAAGTAFQLLWEQPYRPEVAAIGFEVEGTADRQRWDGQIQATPFKLTDPSRFPRRQWIYGRHYIRKFVSVTAAPGGRGKSSLVAFEAMAMATDKRLLGQWVKKPLRVWYVNLEDPLEETHRRLLAIAKHYGITNEDLAERFHADSGREMTIKIAAQDRAGSVIHTPLVEALIAEIEHRRIDALIVDPFVSSHAVSENDNGAIDAVVKEWARIADRTNCAVELVHHVRKGASGAKHELDVDDTRGAGTLVAGSRCARILNGMTVDEAQKAGVQNRHEFFRLSDGKANMGPRSDRAEWYQIISVSLDNGEDAGVMADDFETHYEPPDHVGVVTAWQWPDALEGRGEEDLLAVQKAVAEGAWRYDQRANAWIGRAVAAALDVNADDQHEKNKIKRMVETWIQQGALKVEVRADGSRHERKFVVVREGATE